MLLRPSRALNQIVLGVFGRAQRRYEMPIHALVVMSSHFHLLASPSSAQHLSEFMRYVNTNLSKEVGKLHGWKGPMWQRRYDQIPVSEEDAAQIDRLKYILSHGCKENLVNKPGEWPGIHSVDAILHEGSLKGLWFDRTSEYAARQRDADVDPEAFSTDEVVRLTPLPALQDLELDEYRRVVTDIVKDIEGETAKRHRRQGTTALGARAVLKVQPHESVRKLETSPRPRFHAISRRVRRKLEAHFAEWLNAYREASERWRKGDKLVVFPPWSFPPAPRFLGGIDSG